jgi:hypothetical protein
MTNFFRSFILPIYTNSRSKFILTFAEPDAKVMEGDKVGIYGIER